MRRVIRADAFRCDLFSKLPLSEVGHYPECVTECLKCAELRNLHSSGTSLFLGCIGMSVAESARRTGALSSTVRAITPISPDARKAAGL